MEAALLPDEHNLLGLYEEAETWLGIPETGQSASHLPRRLLG